MIKISLSSWKEWKPSKNVLGLFAFESDPVELVGLGKDSAVRELQQIAKMDGFKGKERETLLIRPTGQKPAERIILIGLGKKNEYTNETLRKAVTRLNRSAETLGLSELVLRTPELGENAEETLLEIQALAEGLHLGNYRFDRHRTSLKDDPKPLAEVTLLTDRSSSALTDGLERAALFSRATMLARDLINEPPSRMNPEILAQEALKLDKKPLSVNVLEKKDLEKLGMGAILGVGAGSAVPPRLVEIIYKPSKPATKTIALVGKGITFDSGGLSLKPAQSMETMKDDMSGAAAVLAVMSVLPELKLNLEVRGYLAIAENMPGGHATKPGDVLKTYSGKTIEVLNTDAEGRLVLADALSYAASKKPDQIMDIATLTGACVVALGGSVSALLSNAPKMVQALVQASEKAGEKFWELPLVKEYQPHIKSKIADVQNIGSKRGEAGTIIGGLFLQEFVDTIPWVHIDIAGPSWVDSDQPYCPTGGTGHPVRTLLHYLESL